eukprot:TRINITY_DN16783_c0_g1_i1.p1 TRINITY_DN16783_c0_g1~~TRINITY_DN16783_c0_g1_i1.p1  ORF type:complete len:453 (+),score=36.40 TRINITY_DN16783_c0_g1_i1:112-1470(+)
MDGSFESYKDQVLRGEVPWDTYVTAKLITGTDFQLLRRYDHRSKEVQAALLEENGAAYVRTFVAVLRSVFKEETVEYTVALLDDLLAADKRRAHLFHDKSITEDVYQPFIRLLGHSNWFVLEATSRILPLIITTRPLHRSPSASASAAPGSSSSPPGDIDYVLEPFIAWLCHQLSHPVHPTRAEPAAISALAVTLRDTSARTIFAKADGVRLLLPHIAPVASQQQMQLLYESVLCLWLLSFHEPSIEAIRGARVLPRLIEVAKSSAKEKIVRVAVLTLLNLMARGHMGASMVELGLPKVVQSLKMHAWHDEDLKEALEGLDAGLRHNLRVMSSFDKYRQEVLSGQLEWTPMHKDAAFWRENIMHFEDNDFQVLRALVSLLDSSHEPRTLAVACHDLGQFISAHPAGRGVAHDMKAKDRVLRLLDHSDGEVRKQALLAVQKLLLSAKYVSYLQ